MYKTFPMLKNITLIGFLLLLNSFKSSKIISNYNDPQIDSSKIAAIKITPPKPLIEKDIYGYYLNFDIIIKNQITHILELNSVEVAVMDATGKLVQRKFI